MVSVRYVSLLSILFAVANLASVSLAQTNFASVSLAQTNFASVSLAQTNFASVSLAQTTAAPENTDGLKRSAEARLKSILFKHYDTTSRPVANDSDTVQAKIGISLFHLMKVNEKQQTVHAAYSYRFTWYDHFLQWNATKYGLKTMFLPASKIWRPDIMLLNTAMDEHFEFLDTNAIVSSDGHVLWMVPFTPVTTCNINVRYYPFDIQHCELQFISWTYAGKQLNLSKHPGEDVIYYSAANQEWDVTEIEAERHDKIYACCPDDPYPDVTFKLHMRRRSLFYVVNLVLPSLLIYGLAVIGFFLPSAEKVNMETTVLLTLVVFLMVISDTMPPTPDSVPVLSLLFVLILLLVALAITMSVVVTYLGERPRFSPIPKWGHRVIKLMFRNSYYHPAVQASLRASRLSKVTATKLRVNDPESSNSSEDQCALSDKNGVGNVDVPEVPQLSDWQIFAEALDRLFFYIFLVLTLGMIALFAAMIFPAMIQSLSYNGD